MATEATVEFSLETPIISVAEHLSYSELGLGRGVDVTDPNMWKSKHRFTVREISSDLGNITGTRECGKLESYKTVVGTFAMQQQKLLLSLDNPCVSIGMDEHYSRSSSATKLIEGKKIETRTISFQFHFDEVPLYENVKAVTFSAPGTFFKECEDLSFEMDLYAWILKRIEDRGRKVTKDTTESGQEPDQEAETESQQRQESIKRLEKKLESYVGPEGEATDELRKVVQDCSDFIKHMCITHYVSAITLGACTYRVVTTKSQEMKVGAGASMGMNSLVEGGLSGAIAKRWFRMTEEVEKIGRMAGESVTTEAVIGFHVQPLYKLVRIQLVQASLRQAIKEYIESKDDKCEGPFVVACEITKKDESKVKKETVYWTIENYKLFGTTSLEAASLFYVLNAGDPTHPSDFYIAYWGTKIGSRDKAMHLRDIYRSDVPEKGQPYLPCYLSTNTNILGQCKGPLSLKTTVEAKQARFSLHSRVQSFWFACMMCTSTPISLSSWLEGEQFYIKCQNYFYKMDGYLAVEVSETSDQIDKTHPYSTTAITCVAGIDPEKTGALFRLYSPPKEENVASPKENDS